jgi:trehalose 6-phosphate synthase/phosphatase
VSESSAGWQAAGNLPSDLIAALVPILEQFVASTPGSVLERKTALLAWHYRAAQRDVGARQAHELRMLLGDVLSNQPFEVLEGKKVVEVRLHE